MDNNQYGNYTKVGRGTLYWLKILVLTFSLEGIINLRYLSCLFLGIFVFMFAFLFLSKCFYSLRNFVSLNTCCPPMSYQSRFETPITRVQIILRQLPQQSSVFWYVTPCSPLKELCSPPAFTLVSCLAYF
jgi:hypothetical protein